MGTWNTGNFDNDGALDFVGDLMHTLQTRIENCLCDENDSRLDEYGEAVIVPGVEILAMLSENCGAAPPQAAVVEGWKTRYLAIFDEQIEGLAPVGDYARERRAIIVATFERLEKIAREFWRS